MAWRPGLHSGSQPNKASASDGALKRLLASSSAEKPRISSTPSSPLTTDPGPPDPWLKFKSRHGGKLSANDEWLKLHRGDVGRLVEVAASQCAVPGKLGEAELDVLIAPPAAAPEAESGAEAGSESGAARLSRQAKLEASRLEPAPEPEPEPETAGVAERLRCASADLVSFSMGAGLRAALISLDLTDNSLQLLTPCCDVSTEGGTPAAADDAPVGNLIVLPAGGCWLRSLCLRANDLRCLPALTAMPKLLELDLSYNLHLGAALGADEPAVRAVFAAVPLRSIKLEGCGLTTLPPGLSTVGTKAGPGGAPRNVFCLHLGFNLIAGRAELQGCVQHFPQLKDLTLLQGNPAGELPEVQEWAAKLAQTTLTSLQRLDQEPVAAVTLVRGTHDPSRGGSSVGGGEDTASCSCVEGNPCISPYNCQNWERRFEVAKAARKRG